jgi:SAM-dependent methyltransferase
MSSDRSRWEARYADAARADPHPPSSWLVQQLQAFVPGAALDLACGDGRNALWLAQRGWQVDAIDIALAGLARLRASAEASGLRIHTVQADLGTYPLPTDRYAAVVNIRYLQRELFPAIRRAVMPGGVVVFETFLREQARHGHPRNPAFLLEAGELAREFAGFEILALEEGLFADGSAPAYLARLLARRR